MNPGDVATLGRHRLMCGDAFNPDHVARLMGDDEAGMLYCDPPYGMALDTAGVKRQGTMNPGGGKTAKKARPRHSYPPVVGDDEPFDPRPIIEAFASCRDQFWWGADYYRARLPDGGAWLVWDKRPALESDGPMDRAFGSGFELCWSRHPHLRRIIRCQWMGVAGMNPIDGKRVHPAQKPVRLAEWFVERYSKPDDVVVDLFAGAGSTLLACERMGRQARVMEISSDYCQVIVERWRALSSARRVRQIPIEECEAAVTPGRDGTR